MENNIYYVYAYLDPTKYGIYEYDNISFNFEPFYIGKGKYYRAYYHWKKVLNNNGKWTNLHFKNKLYYFKNNNIQPIIKIINCNLINKEALLLEEKLVNLIGRSHLKEGPLTNITKEGDGVGSYRTRSDKGKKRKSLSEECKKKISLSHKGKLLSDSHKKKISENSISPKKTWTEESYKKSIETKRKKWPSKEKTLEYIKKYKTKTEVSKKLNISHPTLETICNYYNIKINWLKNSGGNTKFKKKIRPKKEDIIKTLNNLKSIRKTAIYFGFSPNTMKSIFKEYQII
ncbi:MAG: hypothetical protein PHF86_02520 [Candidatus Nanoarchaeia archaeon]|nr:hypothetical protein [Candidatus Nanoarchaeia archaeon]